MEINPEKGKAIQMNNVKRCSYEKCNKKLKMISFDCRCGGKFCPEHRYTSKHNCPSLEDKEQSPEKFLAASPITGESGDTAGISADDIKKIANGFGHPVDPNRLDGLASGVSRLMRQLEALDELDIAGCERAETINLLELSCVDILGV